MIDATKIREILIDSLFTPEEVKNELPKQGYIPGNGITIKVAFHPARLESHREEVKSILEQLNRNFFVDGGGGWSFLNLPFDKDGNQWGEHDTAQQLMILGIALGMITYLIGMRESWGALPGGVPYIVIDLNGKPCEPVLAKEALDIIPKAV